MIEARSYQTEAVQSIYDYFARKQGNPVIAMPTGTGKSVVIAQFLQSIYKRWPLQRVMIVTHVKELVRQNYEKLMAAWPFAPAGVYSAGLKMRDTRSPITFAGIASVANRWSKFGHIDLVMIDEAHLLSPNDDAMYQKFLKGLKSINPALKVIGLTATPYRLGHGHIADGTLFDDVCFDITGIDSFNRLIAEGYLSPLVPKNTGTQIDTDKIAIRGGEYQAGSLNAVVDREEVTYAALREALEVAHDRNHWLIFASGVEHAEHIAEMMESMGQTCAAVHSKMSSEERDKRIAEFQAGKLRALVNNNILTTGFDSPWIDCIVCLRPTMSSVLWVQMLGRGTRPFKGNDIDPKVKENCLALDFAGNTRRLGPINDPVVPRKKGEGGGEAPVKLCTTCNTWNHATARECFICGTKFDFAVKIKQEASTADLIKGELPEVRVYKVDQINYREYVKIGRPPMMKATYYCGMKSFDEYICVEHPHPAGSMAKRWWKARTDNPMPSTTAKALEEVAELPAATHLRVWINKPSKYPQIMAACFDGTAFNSQAPTEDLPTVHADTTNKPLIAPATIDDDIPF